MHFWRGQHFFYSERSGFSQRRGTVVFWLLMHSAVQKNNPSCGGEAVEEPRARGHTAREIERTEEKKEKR